MKLNHLSIEKAVQLSIPLLVSTLPFFVFLFLGNPYELSKFLVFLSVTQILLLISTKKIVDTIGTILRDRLAQLSVLFLLVLLIANLFGIDPHTSLMGSSIRHQGFILYVSLFFLLILIRMYQLSINNKSVIIFLISSITLSLLTICAYIGVTYLNFMTPTYHGRLILTLGNPNFLGSILVMQFLYVFWHFDQIKKILPKDTYLFYLYQALMITAVIIAQSQSAYLALIASYALYLLFFIKRVWLKMFIGIALLILSITTAEIVLNEYSQWDNQPRIWLIAIDKIIESPFLGYGQENLQIVISPLLFYNVDSAHNIFLEVTLAGGLPALIVFLALVIYVLKKSSIKIRIILLCSLITLQFNPASITQLVFLWYLLGISSAKSTD